MGLANFNIDLDASGRASKIEINGTDVAQSHRVASVAVQGRTNELPRVYLELSAEGHIEGEGIVEVRLPAEDDRSSIVDFLSSIDPEALEKEALDRVGFGDSSATPIMLQILAEWANGD